MLNFPNAPADGETSKQPNGITYQWVAADTRWIAAGSDNTSLVAGTVVQTKHVQNGEIVTTTNLMSVGDVIPNDTQGAEILRIPFTPKYANSLIQIDTVVAIAGSVANLALISAIFEDGVSAALSAGYVAKSGGSDISMLSVSAEIAAGSTALRDYTVRAGPSSNQANINSHSGGVRIFGGVSSTFIRVTEIQPDAVVPDGPAFTPGSVIQVQNFTQGAGVSGTVQYPTGSVPTIANGFEYLRLDFTPKKASSKLKIEICAPLFNNSADGYLLGGLFRLSNSLHLGSSSAGRANEIFDGQTMSFWVYVDAVSTDPETYVFRAGSSAAAQTVWLNGANGGWNSGEQAAGIMITEIAQ